MDARIAVVEDMSNVLQRNELQTRQPRELRVDYTKKLFIIHIVIIVVVHHRVQFFVGILTVAGGGV